MEAATGRMPDRRWYVLAAIIAVAAIGGGILYVKIAEPKMEAERLLRVSLPGEADITLREGGTHIIFFEQRAGRGEFVSPSQVQIAVTVRASGNRIIPTVRPGGSFTYRLAQVSGTSVLAFAADAGRYNVVARYDGAPGPPAAVTIDDGFMMGFTVMVAGTVVACMLGLGVAALIIGIVYIRRRRASRFSSSVERSPRSQTFV
jgi:hypothetical protein